MKSTFTADDLASSIGRKPRTAQRLLIKERIPFVTEGGKRVYRGEDLTPKIQKLIVESSRIASENDLPISANNRLYKCGPLVEVVSDSSFRGFPEDLLKNPRVQYWHQIVQEAKTPPPGWQSGKWIKHVAVKYGHAYQTIYEGIAREEERGLAGHLHAKSNRGKPKSWDDPALDYGLGVFLKRPHRRMSEKACYEEMVAEATQRGWRVGGYRSFTQHLAKRLNPLLLAQKNGGRRALDNVLPPVLRTYADLAPFQMGCGDQHDIGYWIMDDETGRVFRPQTYVWLDLRTRILYGFWLGQHYNSYAVGLALRMGCQRFGPFRSIYTDNGRPEISRYITGLANEMALLGIGLGEIVDLPIDLSDGDPEEAACIVINNHIRALPRNGKAKLMEPFFHHLEVRLCDSKIPGAVKRLSASGEEQEVDEIEAKKLAKDGKLLKFSEFALIFAKLAHHYNWQRPHRGLFKEWPEKPRPLEVTPMDALRYSYEHEGWRPVKVPDEIVNLAFLARETRTVDRGRVRFRTACADLYEHSELARLHDQKVVIRFDPLDPRWIIVYHNSKLICVAQPVEYSSMVDKDLARRKIKEKRRLAKLWSDEYQRLTSQIPDLIEYSRIPRLEAAATVVREKLEMEQISGNKLLCEPDPEQLAATVRANLAFETSEEPISVEVELPGRKPPIFEYEIERCQYLIAEKKRGEKLTVTEEKFLTEFVAGIDADTRSILGIVAEITATEDKSTSALQQVG
ncbi:MAG: Mu transposase C-terminal domain-containing protein [Syntrophobacteraceae bacterium]|jgi:putative transposase